MRFFQYEMILRVTDSTTVTTYCTMCMEGCPEWLWGLPSLLSNGYLGMKQLEREADHSPPSSPKVKE